MWLWHAKTVTGVKVQVYDTDPGSILIVCASPLDSLMLQRLSRTHVFSQEPGSREQSQDPGVCPGAATRGLLCSLAAT